MSIPCEAEALDRLVEPWAAKIAASSASTVEAILTHAENVRDALSELAPHGRRTRQLLALRSGLSRPMMSRLETIGRRAELLRRVAGSLPPSVVSLYILARKPLSEFNQALMMDLRGKSCADIKALFALPSPARPTRKLMTILVPCELNQLARKLLIADIEAALSRIIETRMIDVEISLPRGGTKDAAHDGANAQCKEQQTQETRSLADEAGCNGQERDNGQGDDDRIVQDSVAETRACEDRSGKRSPLCPPTQGNAPDTGSEQQGLSLLPGEIAAPPSPARQFFTGEKIAEPKPAPMTSARTPDEDSSIRGNEAFGAVADAAFREIVC